MGRFNGLNIGIDIDLTVVDTVMSEGGWFDYLKRLSKSHLMRDDILRMESVPYALGSLFPQLTKEESQHFWRSPRLYDKLLPKDRAVDAVNTFVSMGHNIYFVSHCRPEHYTSKFEFVKKWFNVPKQQFAFISTEEKGALNIDVMIDDRHNFLNQFLMQKNVIKILMKTPYTQDQALLLDPDLHTDSWELIRDFIIDVS